MTRTEFGARWKAARLEIGLTQEEAASALGIPQPRYAEYESGKRLPPVIRVLEIILALGYNPAIMFPELYEAAESAGLDIPHQSRPKRENRPPKP